MSLREMSNFRKVDGLFYFKKGKKLKLDSYICHVFTFLDFKYKWST